MKKKYIVLIIGISVAIVFTIPIIIDWLIIGNSITSNVSNSDWVGFLGGYIGSLIGSAVSLIGIIITIRYTSEQNKKDRELQIRPYCSIRYVHDDHIFGTDKIIGQLPIGCEPQENNGPRYTGIIYIKNIGLGPAVEFNFNMDKIDDGRKHYQILMQRNSETANHATNLLQPGEEAALPLYIFFNFDPITEDDFYETDEDSLCKYAVKANISWKYKNFDIIIHVKYHDMYQNTYYQKISLCSNMYVGGDFDHKKASYQCDIKLKEITVPKRVDH